MMNSDMVVMGGGTRVVVNSTIPRFQLASFLTSHHRADWNNRK